MKRFLLSLFAFFMFATTLMAQQPPVVNGVMQGSPVTFMVNPATCTQNGWARPYEGSCSSSYSSSPVADMQTYATSFGVATNYDGGASHRLMIRTPAQIAANQNPTDPNGVMYPSSFHIPIFPPAWDRDLRPTAFEDTVMKMGGTSPTARAQKMEYRFIPDTNNPVLLVNFSCVLENGNHAYSQNPSVQILVSGLNDYNPLPLGYYPSDYKMNGNANLGTATPNTNWPYARYYFVQDGYDQANPYPFITPCRWYGDAFKVYTNGAYSSWTSTGYVTVAFNLTEQARTQTPVRLSLLMLGCHQSAHASYMYYTAKMVPGKVTADACGDMVDFTVPFGFNANSYQWERGLDQNMTMIFTPANNYRFSVPTDQVFPYYRCKMESETGVPFTYEAFVSMYDLHADFGYEEMIEQNMHKVFLTDSSRIYAITPAFLTTPPDTMEVPVDRLEWFKRSANNSWQLVAQDTNQVELTYAANVDSAQVMLVIGRPGTSCSDTVVKWLHFEYDPTTVSFSCNFEDASTNDSWNFENGSSTNQWIISEYPDNGTRDVTRNGRYALFVSNDNVNNTYSPEASIIWAYVDVNFGPHPEHNLSFDWKCNGESMYDYLSVFIGDPMPVSAAATFDNAGNMTHVPTGAVTLAPKLNLHSDWQHESYNLGASYTNTTKRIYFRWNNDGDVCHNPAPAIDNVFVTGTDCVKPTNLTVQTTSNSAVLNWDASGAATSWTLYYKEESSDTWTEKTTINTSSMLAGLEAETAYMAYVVANCETGDSEPSNIVNFTTKSKGVEGYESDMTLYPNPTSGQITISCWPTASGKVSVYDEYGKLLKTVNINGSETTIDVAGYAPGIYFAHISTEKGVVTKTFVRK